MLFENIPVEEQNMISNYINTFGFYRGSSGYHTAPLSQILENWDINKSYYLYELLGNQFIISKPVTYETPERLLAEKIDKTLNNPTNEGYTFFSAFMKLSYYNGLFYDNPNFVGMCYHFIWYLASNIYSGLTFSLDLPNGKTFKFTKGAKFTRLLGRFAQEMNLPGFEEFRLIHSQILNTKKLHGNLCLSIHPLDYMTMSDNNMNWSSCMSWDGGQYCAGTIEMMNSHAVIVAYLDSENIPFYLSKDIHWSNKKWRQLFIINKDIIANVKAYPYRCDELTTITLDWLKELANTNLNWNNYCSNIFKYNHEQYCFCEELNKQILIKFNTNKMYNDFSDNQLAYLSKDFPEDYWFNYSGKFTCICCGKSLVDVDGDEDKLTCLDCEPVYYCAECGECISADEMIEIDGQSYCNYCAENCASTCNSCDELHLNMYSIELYDENAGYYYSIELCKECFSKKFKKYFKVKELDYRNGTYYVTPWECTREGLELFGLYPEVIDEYCRES